MSNPILTPAQRELLSKLAAGMFPLDAWIKGAKTYVPPNATTLPWRASGQSLTLADINVMDFLEAVLQADGDDQTTATRWGKLQNAPPQFIGHPKNWRVKHGLSTTAKFGAADSDNVIIAEEETDAAGHHQKRATARLHFYELGLPLLLVAVQKTNPTDWGAFAQQLLVDDNAKTHWPQPPEVEPENFTKSSEFIKVFARDILTAMMGMKNPVAEPFRTALLTELGEFRRAGNAYTVADTQQAVALFKQKIKDVIVAKAPK